jgi:hypothetical protein
MSSNFNSFAPYNAANLQYSSTIFISAQDRLEEIIVDMKARNCQDEDSTYNQSDWPSLSLAGFSEVNMYIKKEGSDELHSEIRGVPLSPLEGGQVLFRVLGESFGGEVGKYVGLVEVRYKSSDRSGDRIVTARNYIPLEVREDFYCNPFDEYFSECAGSN